jgi:hypothetical protein
MQRRLPIRVIRAVEDKAMPCGRCFTYDGLYQVEGYTLEAPCKTTFKQFTFTLRRVPEQSALYQPQVRVRATHGSACESHPRHSELLLGGVAVTERERERER